MIVANCLTGVDRRRTTSASSALEPIEDMLRFWGGRFDDDLIAKARVDPRWGYAARLVQGTPGAQEAADAAEAGWPDFRNLTALAEESLRAADL